MIESWFNDAARGLFATIDRAVYSLVSVVYEIMMQISQVIIFDNDTLREFSSKVYSLLGLFMLFKISFSFISYLVNPDQINDKSKGANKIIVNVVIVLALIIVTPTAFTKLYQAQNAILKDNIIPRFFLQTKGDIGGDRSYRMADECGDKIAYTKTDGDYIAMLIFRPFYQVEKGRTLGTKDLDNYCKIGNIGEVNYATPSAYLAANIVNASPNGTKDMYVIDYKFAISSIVGIVILLILVSFCFDIAVRSIKLGFLQLIAPIPIISYVDPKSGKDGMFSKWLKEVGKTWASLFVRLIAIFFAVYVIKLVIVQENLKTITGEEIQYKFWVDLFLIIGALMFAKKLPKLLEDILGIKLDGGLTLNPMKKIRDQALGGKAITGGLKAGVAGAAGLGLGVAANTAALATNIKKDGLKKAFMGESKGVKGGFRAIGTGLGVFAGGTSAAFHGAIGAYKNDSLKKGIMPGLKKSVDNRDLRDKRQDMGYNTSTRIMDKMRSTAGIKTNAKIRSEQLESNIARLQAAQQSISFRQQAYMGSLSSDNISNLMAITSKKDAQGNTIYSFADEVGNSRTINGQTEFNENDVKNLLLSGQLGSAVSATDINNAMEYTKLQAERNAMDKEIFGNMKKQKGLATEDSKAKK